MIRWAQCLEPEQAAEKFEFRPAAPEGGIDNEALAVCLKAYPDTNREFFRKLLALNADEDDGSIVAHTGAIGEGADIVDDADGGRASGDRVLHEPVKAVLLFIAVYSFGDAIGIKDKARTRG